jgi:hypothetical protein
VGSGYRVYLSGLGIVGVIWIGEWL